MEERCWWCGNQADSKEHRHKKSDVKHIFGQRFEGKSVSIRDYYQTDVQGPDSQLLKFEKVLCKVCNNSTSQPFDRAYDLFIKYVLGNYDKLLHKRIIDLNDIVQDDTSKFRDNVARYITKVFCCRLACNNISIKPRLIEFLNYEKPINYLYIKFEVRSDIYAFLNMQKPAEFGGNIYLSPLMYFPPVASNQINLVYQFYNLQWLRIYTFYSEKMTEEFYPGYTKNNNLDIIPIEVRNSVALDRFFDIRTDTRPKKQEQ